MEFRWVRDMFQKRKNYVDHIYTGNITIQNAPLKIRSRNFHFSNIFQKKSLEFYDGFKINVLLESSMISRLS